MDEPFPILKPNYTSLGANVKGIFVPFWDLMPTTENIEVNGVKVALIGLTSNIIEDMHVFITLGIVVDDTIHFLSKYLRARHEKNLSSVDTICLFNSWYCLMGNNHHINGWL